MNPPMLIVLSFSGSSLQKRGPDWTRGKTDWLDYVVGEHRNNGQQRSEQSSGQYAAFEEEEEESKCLHYYYRLCHVATTH